jgi:hypothetical protein
MFKVVPDQLKVSDGWVRCGHCDGVFDASAHFQANAEPGSLEVPDAEVEEMSPSVTFVVQTAPSPAEELPDDASVSAPLSSYLSAPEAADLPVQDDQARSQESANRGELSASTKAKKHVNSAKLEDASRQPLPDVTFVATAKRRDKPKGPIYRVLAVLFTIGLLVTLALQVLLHERDALAARYPALLPALEVLCQKMACQVNPPRVIEAITIDSSSFTQTGPDAYRLNLVLKNTRSAVVAMPALEVTLTGSQNEVLMRRVLLPAEFGATHNRLEQGIPFAGGLTLLVSQPPVSVQPSSAASSVDAVPAEVTPEAHSPAASVPITGYRLFAFYP